MNQLFDAYARLMAYRKNIPESPPFGLIGLPYIQEYHDIVNLIEATVGEKLDQYKVPASAINPKVTSYNMMSGNKTYSEEVYCERTMLCMKVDALLNRLSFNESKTTIGFSN